MSSVHLLPLAAKTGKLDLPGATAQKRTDTSAKVKPSAGMFLVQAGDKFDLKTKSAELCKHEITKAGNGSRILQNGIAT